MRRGIPFREKKNKYRIRYIFLLTGIVDLLGVYADGLPDTSGILHGTGHNLLRHCNTS